MEGFARSFTSVGPRIPLSFWGVWIKRALSAVTSSLEWAFSLPANSLLELTFLNFRVPVS